MGSWLYSQLRRGPYRKTAWVQSSLAAAEGIPGQPGLQCESLCKDSKWINRYTLKCVKVDSWHQPYQNRMSGWGNGFVGKVSLQTPGLEFVCIHWGKKNAKGNGTVSFSISMETPNKKFSLAPSELMPCWLVWNWKLVFSSVTLTSLYTGVGSPCWTLRSVPMEMATFSRSAWS